MKYPQGTRFIRRGDKHRRICTVIDYHTTRNLSGDIVRERYVAGHEFMGQIIIERDICETTISRGEILP